MRKLLFFILLSVAAHAQVTVCNPPLSLCAPDTPVSGAPVWNDTGGIIKSFFVPPVFNATALEPNSGARMLWTGDPTHPCDGTHNGSSWVTPSFSAMRAFSPMSAADIANSTYYFVISSAPDGAFVNPCVLTITRSPNFQVTARTDLSSFHFTPYGSFDRTHPHIWAAPDNSNPWLIKTIDVSNAGAGVTNIVDLSQSANCPNINTLTITTNGEITWNYAGTRFAYWGNGAQDTATNSWVYDTTKGCLWLNWATGDINAAAGWGMSTTTCSACIPSTYRCTQSAGACTASHGVHRSYLDADGLTLWTENQTFATGPVVFIIPPAGAWPSGAAMFTECDNSPSNPLCQNHKDFIPGGYMVNGAGDVLGANNTLLADRIRPVLNPNTSTSGCTTPLSGWCNLLNTINPGTQVLGNASHDSAGAGDSGLTMPFAEGAYMNGSGTAHVTFAWSQELDLISPNFSSQHRWREIQHHMKAQLGSCTGGLCGNSAFGGGVICNGTSCAVTTMGPHGFVATNSVTAYNCQPSTLNATGITVAAAGSTTTFSVTSGWQTATTTVGECMFDNPLAGAQDFYATTLLQLSQDGKLLCTPDNSERTNAADANRGANCASSVCSQIFVLCIENK